MNQTAVSYRDLKAQYRAHREEILATLDRVCCKGSSTLGEEATHFEEEFTAYCETKHCVAVKSGTRALPFAVPCVRVSLGDRVINPPNTFVATFKAISFTVAHPIFVDIEPSTAGVDPLLIAAVAARQAQSHAAIHRAGRPVNSDAIAAEAARQHLKLIENACPPLGGAASRLSGF